MLIETENYRLNGYVSGDPERAKYLGIVVPGRVEAHNQEHILAHVDYLASELGFLAVTYDAPGIWGSSKKHDSDKGVAQVDIKDYTVSNDLQAIDETIDYCGNRPTFVIGASQGGRRGMQAAERNPLIRAVVAIATKYKFVTPDTYESRVTEWSEKGFKTFSVKAPDGTDHSIDIPYSHSEDAQKYNSTAGLAKLLIPKLFVILTGDSVVTHMEAMDTAGKVPAPKELRSIDSGHYYGKDPSHVQQANEFMGAFFRRHFDLAQKAHAA